MDMSAALPFREAWKKNDPMELIAEPLRDVPVSRLEEFLIEYETDPKRTVKHKIDMDHVSAEDDAKLRELISAFSKEVQKDIYDLESRKNRRYCRTNGYRDLRKKRVAQKYKSPYGLLARMTKIALELAANVYQHNRWRGIQTRILGRLYEKEWFWKLNDTEKAYMWHLLNSLNDDFFDVIDGKLAKPVKAKDELMIEDRRGLCRWIRHAFKRELDSTPVLKLCRSAKFDEGCWSWKKIKGVTYIRLTSLEKGNRIELPLMGERPLPISKSDPGSEDGWHRAGASALLVTTPQGYFFHVTRDLKVTEQPNALREEKGDDGTRRCRACDTGMTEVLVDDEGNVYGAGLRELLERNAESYTRKHAERQKFEALARNTEDPRVRRNVEMNNLGHERFDELEFKLRQRVENHVNRALNEFIDKAIRDGVEVILMEDLRHGFRLPEGLPARLKRVFSAWLPAFIRERLRYKAFQHGLKVACIPAAYSSQGCAACSYTFYGNRRGDQFKCRACGAEFHSDRLGAVNLLRRVNSERWTSRMGVEQSWRAARLEYEEECAKRGISPLPEKRRPRRGGKRTKSREAACSEQRPSA